jgi:hypothetical protein
MARRHLSEAEVLLPMQPELHHWGGRRIMTRLDEERDMLRIYDCDYGIELEPIHGEALRCAALAGRGAMRDFFAEALREPTSLELLYYAQVGGPHVRGAL